MPKLHRKISVLDGRATVLAYERNPDDWFYREIISPGNYRSRKIEGATTALEAQKKALDIYTELRQSDKLASASGISTKTQKRSKKASIDISISEHLKEMQKKADAETVTQEYVKTKGFRLRHIKSYLEYKQIKYAIDIKDDTFDDYELFRRGTTKVNISNEVKALSQWLNWCRKNRQLKADVAALKLTPKIAIKGEDLTANPPISPEDWRKIERYIRVDYAGQRVNDRRGIYWRQCFHAFVMTAKNSGMRPKELLNLKWSDINIVDMGQKSQSDERRHLVAEINVRKTKTKESRQVPANCGKQLKEWLEFQKEFAARYYSEGIKRVFNKDSFVFCNMNNNCEPYSLSQVQQTMRAIYRRLDLRGHWSSDKPYTLSSLRSTFIDEQLMKDIPIAVLSMMTGHDPKALMKYYQQLDVLRKTRELTALPIGRKKDNKQSLELWND